MQESTIQVMRKQMGVSTYELARRAGVSQPTVINWERREREGGLTLGSLRKAAEALQCDVYVALEPREAGARSAPASIPRSIDPNEIWDN